MAAKIVKNGPILNFERDFLKICLITFLLIRYVRVSLISGKLQHIVVLIKYLITTYLLIYPPHMGLDVLYI